MGKWEYFRFLGPESDRALGFHTFQGFDGDITWAACRRFGQYGGGKGDIEWWEGKEELPEEARCPDCLATGAEPGAGFAHEHVVLSPAQREIVGHMLAGASVNVSRYPTLELQHGTSWIEYPPRRIPVADRDVEALAETPYVRRVTDESESILVARFVVDRGAVLDALRIDETEPQPPAIPPGSTDPEAWFALQKLAKSDEYNCPCDDEETGRPCTGRVTLRWERGDEDYRYPPQWIEPVIEGCERHHDRLNDDTTEAMYVIHEYYERRRWRERLGLDPKMGIPN